MLRLICAEDLVMADGRAGREGFKSYRAFFMTLFRLFFCAFFFVFRYKAADLFTGIVPKRVAESSL